MAYSVFEDKDHIPDDTELSKALGRSKASWDNLITFLYAEYRPITEKWQFGGAKYGWTLRMIQKKRTILYMTPGDKHILIGFVLGEKAVKSAQECGLDPDILEIIDEAPRYGEGRGIRIGVRTKKDFGNILKMVEVKMAK